MIIEVTGVNTWNKGAELMLVAIRDHFARHHPGVHLAVDTRFGSYLDRARYGLLQKVEVRRPGRSKLALAVMPSSFRKSFGLVSGRDVDAVLDASGFAFGDQHPAERAVRFAREVAAMRRAEKVVVLMPQALGPFEHAPTRDAFAHIVEGSNLVFARDAVSLAHARNAVPHPDRVFLAPDFTNLVKPLSEAEQGSTDTVCIVPNQRMIEKAGDASAAASYVPLMASGIAAIEEAGLRPLLLVHGHHDAPLVQHIVEQVGHAVPCVQEADPVEIKRLLGRSRLVIGSRFHALVSALSQGVPCIATSWSHKYEMLFKDYACEEMVLPVPSTVDQIRTCVDQAIGAARPDLVARIKQSAERLVHQVHGMWERVDRELGLINT